MSEAGKDINASSKQEMVVWTREISKEIKIYMEQQGIAKCTGCLLGFWLRQIMVNPFNIVKAKEIFLN